MPLLKKLMRRAAVAAVALALLLLVGYLGGTLFFVGMLGLAILALSEYFSALQTKDIRANVGLG